MTWSPPNNLTPTNYLIKRSCYESCGDEYQSDTFSCTTSSQYYLSTGIAPYSQCEFTLIGLYGAETIVFSSATIGESFIKHGNYIIVFYRS